MKIEKISIFLTALLLLAVFSGTVTAANENNNKNVTYNAIKDITTKEQAQARINYLDGQISALQYQIGIINRNISQKKDQIKYLKQRLIFAYSTNNIGLAKLIESKINNLQNDIGALKSQRVTLLNTRDKYSSEMEVLKIQWGIKDLA